MKKKFWLVLLTVVMTVATLIGLTACALTEGGDNNDSNNTPSCTHSYTYTTKDEKQHTCICTKCGGVFVQNHSFNKNNICTKCGAIKSSGESSTQNKKTISLNPNGGQLNKSEDIQTQDFEVGKVMSALPIPTRDGYTFVAWRDAFGKEYNSATVMPNESFALIAQWEKIITTFEDEYVSFKPASEGKKQDPLYYAGYEGIHQYLYIEFSSDDLGGVQKVGERNNFDLSQKAEMEYSVKKGYTLTWYEGDFNTPNGAQLFTLGYGSNIQLLTVSEGQRVLKRYLVDIYVKHDYYMSLYTDIFAEKPYDTVRVVENERFSSLTEVKPLTGFEFDKRVYWNSKTAAYEDFVYSTPIRKDWDLYQTYKPVTVKTELDGGTLEGGLTIQAYTKNLRLPAPQKEGYDFLGWKTSDGKYYADIAGYAGEHYLNTSNRDYTFTATYAKKHFYYSETEDFDNDQTIFKAERTVPIVTYTDATKTEILEVYYTVYGEDCALPSLTPRDDGRLFKYWKYDGENGSSQFDFNRKIIEPVALYPYTESATYFNPVTGKQTVYHAVPLNEEKTFTTADVVDNSLFRMSLPTDGEYTFTLKTSGTVQFTVNAYYTNSARSYTATSSLPVTIKLQYASTSTQSFPNGGTVTFEVSSCTASFTAGVVGVTAKTNGEPIEMNEENTLLLNDEVELSAHRTGYTVEGWYKNNTLLTNNSKYAIIVKNEEFTYNVKWIYYTLTASVNDSLAGRVTVKEQEKTTAGDTVALSAYTNNGYTWLGWYNGDTLLTNEFEYTFIMPAENLQYTAKWIACPVVFEKNIEEAGAINFPQITKIGESTTIKVNTNSGYTFIGWYQGETLLTNKLSYTFLMPMGNIVYTAKWVVCTVSLTVNDKNAGTVDGTERFVSNNKITLTAYTNAGYKFLGWYEGENLLDAAEECTVMFPQEAVTYTAKWERELDAMANFIYSHNATTNTYEITGIKDNTVTEIIVPNYVTSIEYGAFSGCGNLVSITIPFTGYSVNSDYGGQLFGRIFGNDSYAGGIKIEQYYYPGSGLNERAATYYIPSSLRNVTLTGISQKGYAGYEFYNCSGLISVTIEDCAVGYIHEAMFYNCSNLESVTIGNGITGISYRAFSGCTKLKSLKIGKSLKSLAHGSYLGFDSSNLSTIIANEGNPQYHSEGNCLIETETKTLVLGCITSVIPIDGSVTSIGKDAFSGRSGLTSIMIPNSVTSIGENAFNGCSGLTSVTIPDSVASMGYSAFGGCSGLTGVTIGSGVTTMANRVFYGCSGLTSITVVQGNPKYHSAGNCLIETSSKILVLGCNASIIPADGSVTAIERYAFYSCGGLTSVTIPDSVTSIGYCAFKSCSGLKSVTIGNGVTSIDNYAFVGCSGLTSVIFENPNGWWYSHNSTAASGTRISSSDLSNPATAAAYLVSTYCSRYWRRS